MNLATILARNARSHGDRCAVVFDGQRLTWRELDGRVNRLGHALAALGIGRGDAVAFVLPNGLELLALYWACARLGAVSVPLSPMLRGAGLASLIADSGARCVIAHRDVLAAVDAARDALSGVSVGHFLSVDAYHASGWRDLATLCAEAPPTALPDAGVGADDAFNIIYSSGTTGLPKGIVLSHGVRAWYGALFSGCFRIAPESMVLQTGSLVFNGALLMMFACFHAGATLVLHRGFDASAFIDAVEAERVSHCMLVPAQTIAVLRTPGFEPERLASLSMLLSLGAPMLRQYKDELAACLPGRYHELYGLTEGFVTVLDRGDVARKPDSVGVPLPLFEMRIVDDEGHDVSPGEVGEIIGRGPILMQGYHRQPDLTAAAIRDGWLYSGDLGRVDADGFLHLVDRKKDLIISAGINVYPRDIEEILATHPAVRECAVFGVADDRRGETPVAAVLLHDGETVTAIALAEWLNARVAAAYQRVREVRIQDDFPRSTAGKTLKRELRERWQDG
ncbi:MAG TPA: class I adenylate-forming enzyme family protein [Xanthomonadaceae bacterium]|nr:class I adenylate-forming enzyme family protein [Xanthomonadaceae bacterium]